MHLFWRMKKPAGVKDGGRTSTGKLRATEKHTFPPEGCKTISVSRQPPFNFAAYASA